MKSPRNIRDPGASFEVGVFGEGAKLKPAETPYLQALKKLTRENIKSKQITFDRNRSC